MNFIFNNKIDLKFRRKKKAEKVATEKTASKLKKNSIFLHFLPFSFTFLRFHSKQTEKKNSCIFSAAKRNSETGNDLPKNITNLNVREKNRRLQKRRRRKTGRDHDAGGARDRQLRRRHQLVPGSSSAGATSGRHIRATCPIRRVTHSNLSVLHSSECNFEWVEKTKGD